MNKIAHRTIVTILLLMLISIDILATDWDTTSNKIIHVVGIDLKPGYLFPTHDFFKGSNNAQKEISSALSEHLKYGFKFAPNSYLGKVYPDAIQGVGVGYNTFFNSSELGNPLAVYVFQTSRIANITQKLTVDYEWNFGASFGWKKYDEEKNPYNRVVGSNANAYIHLGFLLNWQLSSNTNLRGGVGLTHFSNGNTSYPNAGVNTIETSIGVTRYIGNDERNTHSRYQSRQNSFSSYINYDLILYGSTRKKGIFPEDSDPMLVPGSFGVVGLNFNPLYNFSKYFRGGVSLDLQYDESANILKHIANDYIPGNPEDLKFYRPSFREQFSAGLSLRAEIVMPIFLINLGIGKNFLCKGDDTNSFYQTFVLKANVTDNVFLHAGYQLYRFEEPNNLMLGLGYRFNAK